MFEKCFICGENIGQFEWTYGYVVNCRVCGEYEPSEGFIMSVHNNPPKNSYLLSGALRENYLKGIVFKVNNAQDLLDSVNIPQNPIESIDKLILSVVSNPDERSRGVWADFEKNYPLAYAEDASEFKYYLRLAVELGYFTLPPSQMMGNYDLSAEGWLRLTELLNAKLKSNQAFVAMWFDESLRSIWEDGLRPALLQTGYQPMRLDAAEFNEKIDDKIIAEIRKSGLLVADFTEQRGSVYFEAGFAMGLGIPVIWTCRDTDIENIQFDTRQYNYIVWNNADDLREKLINRIEATLPNRVKTKKRLSASREAFEN